MKNHPQLSEKDLQQIFDRPSFYRIGWRWLVGAVKFLISFTLLFVLFFLLINLPAYWKRTLFNIQGEEKYSQNLSQPDREMIEPLRQTETAPLQSIQTASHLPQDRLVIPKLKINAPIGWEIPPEKIIEKLKNGVVHYQGTNLPGENGNVFITGHSSNFWWAEGGYKEIFALLDNLENNDKIYITYNKNLYIYQVEEKKIVNPTQIEILNPTDHSILSLMTCYPVGTTINRLVITAKQVSPQPQEEKVRREKSKLEHLPVIR